MKLEVLKKTGGLTGAKVDLPKEVFGVEPNSHAVYLAVKVHNTNSRQGTSATRTRAMVRGGGKKPWKQKGRGVARAGTSRSPLWVGGGRTFGPQPRDCSMKLPRKVKALARKSVFSDKAANDQIKIVEDFKLGKPKTREVVSILRSLGLDGKKTLLLLSEHDADVLRAGRNIPKLRIRVARTESTYDLLDCETIVIQQSAIQKLVGGQG